VDQRVAVRTENSEIGTTRQSRYVGGGKLPAVVDLQNPLAKAIKIGRVLPPASRTNAARAPQSLGPQQAASSSRIPDCFRHQALKGGGFRCRDRFRESLPCAFTP
jgi:hypothetical protein